MVKSNIPLVVVVPAHNEEKYLARSLAALVKQSATRSSYEIVVVDNASDDATASIAKQYMATVIKQPVKGYTRTIQAGCDYAMSMGAEWIALTDADGEVDAEWVETILRHKDEKNLVGLTGHVSFYDSGLMVNWLSGAGYQAFMWLICRPIGGFIQFTGQNCAFKVSAYRAVGGINPNYVMSPDVDLSKRLSTHGRVNFSRKLKVKVSSRRFREYPLKSLYHYGLGFLSVVRSRNTNFEPKDIR